MRKLAFVELRRVRVSFAMFTVAGALLPALLSANVRIAIAPTNAAFMAACLAASLASRLFARGNARPDAAYFAALPIASATWFRVRVALGLALLAGSIAIQALAWHSPLFDLLRGPSLWAHFGRERPELGPVVALALLTFGTTAYFATAFERVDPSRQAGLPGYFVAVAFLVALGSDALVFHAPLAVGAIGAMTAFALWCASVMHGRRAVTSGLVDERVLTSGTRGQVAVHAAGQLAFVVAPLVVAVAHPSTLWDFFGPAEPARVAWVFLAIGVVALPWTLAECRAAARTRFRRGWIACLRTTGIGIPLSKALRNAADLVTCAHCKHPREAEVAVCPRCSARGTKRRSIGSWRARVGSLTPWPVAVFAFFGFLVAIALAQALDVPPRREWTAVADLPGVGLVARGPSSRAEPASCSEHLSAAKLAATRGTRWSTASRASLDLAFPVTTDVLASTLVKRDVSPTDTSPEAPPMPLDALALDVVGLDGARIDRIETGERRHDRVRETRVWIHLHARELEQLADEFLDAALAGAVDHAIAERVESAHAAWITLLVRRASERLRRPFTPAALRGGFPPGGRPSEAQALHSALERAVRLAYRIDRADPRAVAAHCWQELDDRRSYEPPSAGVFGTLPFDVAYVYGPVRALAFVAQSREIETRIRRGDALAALAAGWSGRRELGDACRKLLARSLPRSRLLSGDWGHDTRDVRPHLLRAVSAAWALFALDPERSAFDLLERLERARIESESPLWSLLGYSGDLALARSFRTQLDCWYPADATGRSLNEIVPRIARAIESGVVPEQFWLGW